MADAGLARTLEDLAREIDNVVFRMEGAPPEEREKLTRLWADLRGRLERVRERLEDAARNL